MCNKSKINNFIPILDVFGGKIYKNILPQVAVAGRVGDSGNP
jgi:hypothetical protein